MLPATTSKIQTKNVIWKLNKFSDNLSWPKLPKLFSFLLVCIKRNYISEVNGTDIKDYEKCPSTDVTNFKGQ